MAPKRKIAAKPVPAALAKKADAPKLKRKRASEGEAVTPPVAERPAVRRRTTAVRLKPAVEPLPLVEHHSHGTVRNRLT